jgi:hypothetical protein
MGVIMIPFSHTPIISKFNDVFDSLKAQIDDLQDDYFITNDDEKLYSYFLEKHMMNELIIVETPIQKRLDKVKVKVPNIVGNSNLSLVRYSEVDGTRLTFEYSFSGDSFLFDCRPNTVFLSRVPEIELIRNTFKVFSEEINSLLESNSMVLQVRIEKDFRLITSAVDSVNKEVNVFNSQLMKTIKTLILSRRQQIDLMQKLHNTYEIPLIPINPSLVNVIKVQKKVIELNQPTKSAPEYCMSDESYRDILDIIKHTCCTFERTSKTYRNFQEEELRDSILASLNGIFKGSAASEAFRKNGHTDICLEFINRAAFVAECKFWRGEKSIIDAIEQLLGYITWRDNKLCLIIFSRNSDFFKVLEKSKGLLKSLEDLESYNEENRNEIRITLRSKKNSNQLIKIQVMIFDLSIKGEIQIET